MKMILGESICNSKFREYYYYGFYKPPNRISLALNNHFLSSRHINLTFAMKSY